MIKAAVYILSYDEDPNDPTPRGEGRDFQELAAPSPLHDEDMNQWIWFDLHAPLQRLSWQEGQTVYLSMPHGEYALACRVVSRASAFERRPYRELVAVYADRSVLREVGSPEEAFAGIDWDGLFHDRSGSVELDARPLASDPYGQALRKELAEASDNSKVATRLWRHLSKPSTLYWTLSGLPLADKTRARAITGIDPQWDLSSLGEFDVRIFASLTPTDYDPESSVFQENLKARQARFLHDHVPQSNYDLQAVKASIGRLSLQVTEADLYPLKDIEPLKADLKWVQSQFRIVAGRFDPELRETVRDKRLDQETVRRLRETWGAWIDPVAKDMKTLEPAVARLRSAPPTGPTEDDVRRMAAEGDDKLTKKVEALNSRVDGLQKQVFQKAPKVERPQDDDLKPPARLWDSKWVLIGLGVGVLVLALAGGVASKILGREEGSGTPGAPKTEEGLTLEVYADPSLRKPLADVARNFEDAHPDVKVHLAYGTRIEMAEPIDVFAGVDEKDAQGRARNFMNLAVDALTRTPFATNTLVVVGASEVKNLEKVQQIATVIYAGGYVTKALAAGKKEWGDKWFDAVKGRVVVPEKPDVPSMTWAWNMVEKRKAAAGIVYGTDAFGGGRPSEPVPERWYPPITYVAVVLKKAKKPELAQEFVKELVSKDGKNAFKSYGFGLPTP